MNISDMIMPLLIGLILFHGVYKGVDVYSAFVEGAMDGTKSALKIFPYILAIIFAINLFILSGAEDFIAGILKPVTSFIGFPAELLSLVLVKPLSGGGSLGTFQTVLDTYGPDSYIGRCASVIMGSSETIFYSCAVYFGSVGISDYRYTIRAGLLSHAATVTAALIVCRLVF
jgi:spore maturation protein B